MNRHFGFSRTQLRFIVVLCLTAAVMGGYLLIRAYVWPSKHAIAMPIHEADTSGVYRGILIIDINSSPRDSLELLEGIGPVLSERIVNFRRRRPFESVDDLAGVAGIGPATVAKLRPHLRVSDE